MGRGPQEHDQEQDDRFKPDVAGCRRPADRRWQRPGGAADDDVLWRAPLQPDRVHDDVEEDRESEQSRRLKVGRERQNRDRTSGKDKSECQRFPPRDRAARDWPHRGAAHDAIDVGVVPHVEHAGRPGSDGDCNNCHGAKKKIEVRRCNQHSGEGSEDGEQHHARFHQREELG